MIGHEPGRAVAPPRAAIVGLWLLLLSWAPADAGAQVAFMDPPRGHLERVHEIDAFVDGEFGGDLDAGGKFARVNTGLRYTTDGAINRNVGLGLGLGFTYDGYDFDSSSNPTCAPTDACFQVPPWKSIYTMDIAPSAGIVLAPEIQILAWVPMRFALEAGARESGFTGGVIAGVRTAFNQGRFATTLAVGVQSDIERSVRVFPVIGIDWQLGQSWRIVTEGGPYEGGLVSLLFGPSEQVKLSLSAGWERKRFRLSSGGERSPNGVGQQENAPILAGFDIRLSPAFRIEFHGGLSVAGRMSIDDSGGNRLLKSDYDVAGRAGGALEIVF